MSTTIPPNALIVIADGREAILPRNTGWGADVSLREERRLSPKDLAHDDPSGSRPEKQTPRQTDEATFAKRLARTPLTMRKAGDYQALVLFADPQTLGQIREALHKTVTANLVKSHAKDLTHHSLRDIEAALNA